MTTLSLSSPFVRQRLELTARLFPGLGVAALLALAAYPLGQLFPFIGTPVMGILLGLVVANLLPLDRSIDAGVSFSAQKLLQWAIIGLGLKLNLVQLWAVGSQSLQVTIVTLSMAFFSAWLLGRWLKVSGAMTILVGAGTAICGGSAIAAIAPIIRPKERDLMLALTTIFLFNMIAVLLFPALGHLMGLSDKGFGIWAGTAINDTSSVVAAAYSYSTQAGDIATIIKLTRATLILPVCLVLAVVFSVKRRQQEGINLKAVFPWFILGFVLASGLHTLGWLPAVVESQLATLSHFLLIMALVAVGLNSNLKQLLSAGGKPILLGLGVWCCVAVSSLGVQWVMGSL